MESPEKSGYEELAMNRSEVLELAQKHFFAAMLKGWAAGAKGVSGGRLDFRKEIVYRSTPFLVIDSYKVYESGKSEGETRISYGSHDVWFMSYGGFYMKKDIQFLKRALMFAYKEPHFYGGRGPLLYHEGETDDTIRYVNDLDTGSTFENFSGTESLRGPGQRLRGLHHYWGMALI